MSRARQPVKNQRVVTRQVGIETIVYDLATARTTRLEPLAARVWEACDGTRDASAIALEFGLATDVVEGVIGQLDEADLLTPLTSRRRVLAGAGLVIATPLVSIVAPQAAAAGTATPTVTAQPQSCNFNSAQQPVLLTATGFDPGQAIQFGYRYGSQTGTTTNLGPTQSTDQTGSVSYTATLTNPPMGTYYFTATGPVGGASQTAVSTGVPISCSD